MPAGVVRAKANFCFESEVWSSVIEETINLKEVFRQKEQSFVDMLNRFRVGRVLDEDQARLQQCVVNLKHHTEPDGIEPTRLYPTRNNSDRHNNESMRKLKSPWETFKATNSGDEYALQSLDKNCTAPAELALKSNAQVILLKNIDVKEGLVNGARGVIDSFRKAKTADFKQRGQGRTKEDLQYGVEFWPVVRFANGVTRLIMSEKWSTTVGGKEIAKRLQIPLAPAWALSIHKAQGMTLDRVTVSLENIFEDGQAYVALSRVTGLAGLRLSGFKKSCIKANPAVVAFYQQVDEEAAVREGGGGGGGGGGGAAPKAVSQFAFKPGRNADSGGEAAPSPAIITEETVAQAERQARIQANRATALAKRRNAKRSLDDPPQTAADNGASSKDGGPPAKVPKLVAAISSSGPTEVAAAAAAVRMATTTPSHSTAAAATAALLASTRAPAVPKPTSAATAAAAAWALFPDPDDGAAMAGISDPGSTAATPPVSVSALVPAPVSSVQSPLPLAARIQANREKAKALRLRRESESSPESSGSSCSGGGSRSGGGSGSNGSGARSWARVAKGAVACHGDVPESTLLLETMDVDVNEASMEIAVKMAIGGANVHVPNNASAAAAAATPSPAEGPPKMAPLPSPLGMPRIPLAQVQRARPQMPQQKVQQQQQMQLHKGVDRTAMAPDAPRTTAVPAVSRAQANRMAAMKRRQQRLANTANGTA